MALDLITSWQIDGEIMETVTDFIFLGSKIIADGDCNHEIKRHLLFGRKALTNLDSVLKRRDITLPTKVYIVKAMVFLVVMYGCESGTIKKAEWTKCRSCLCVCMCVCVCCGVSHLVVSDSATLWTVVCQAFLSMGFPRQEYWSGGPFPPPGDLPNPGTEPVSSVSPALQADSLHTRPSGKPSSCL